LLCTERSPAFGRLFLSDLPKLPAFFCVVLWLHGNYCKFGIQMSARRIQRVLIAPVEQWRSRLVDLHNDAADPKLKLETNLARSQVFRTLARVLPYRQNQDPRLYGNAVKHRSPG